MSKHTPTRCAKCNGDISEYKLGSTLCAWCEAERAEPKHTPGPWIVREYHDGTWSVFALGDPNNEESLDTLCKLEDGFESSYEANARLIAAAPELLRELRRCLIELSGWCENEAVPDEVSIEMATRMGHINTLLNKATE